MKYYFINNPVSGSKQNRQMFIDSLAKVEGNYQLIDTLKTGDAYTFARDISQAAADEGENVRIFACGGDGTVNEVINGCMGFDNVEVGVIPLGTGNDFVRCFGEWDQYMDLASYMDAPSIPCDTIAYENTVDGNVVSGHCNNMFNIGLDCNVVDLTEKIKKVPLINGSMSYLVSVFLKFIEKKGTDLRITYDDGSVYDDKLLLISIGNGSFCGGGIKGLPLAVLNDGLMDASLVKNISRRDFLKLFPLYSKGEHLDHELVTVKKILEYKQCENMEITPNEGKIKICIDGEICYSEGLKLSMAKESFRFITPQN